MVTGVRGDAARSALAGTRFGDVRWVAETGSTNRDLLELAAGRRARRDRAGGRPPDGRTGSPRPHVGGAARIVPPDVGAPAPAARPADAPPVDGCDGPAVADGRGRDGSRRRSGSSGRTTWSWIRPARKLAGVLAESVVDGRRSSGRRGRGRAQRDWPTPLPPTSWPGSPRRSTTSPVVAVDREALLRPCSSASSAGAASSDGGPGSGLRSSARPGCSVHARAPRPGRPRPPLGRGHRHRPRRAGQPGGRRRRRRAPRHRGRRRRPPPAGLIRLFARTCAVT